MDILISGGTGFIGKTIVNDMIDKGHHVKVLTRKLRTSEHTHLDYIQWLVPGSNPWQNINHVDIIINLAGDSLNEGRWTSKKKKIIIKSRLDTTREILKIIEHLEEKPKLLINASAVGVYGYSQIERFTESSQTTTDNFPAKVCNDWESLAHQAKSEFGVRTVLARFGIVLGREGGALAKMAMPYHFFAGGPIGPGDQWVSWIHKDDVVGLIEHIIIHDDIQDAFNFTAPEPVMMAHFGETISQVLNRPHWLSVPNFILKLAFGEMSEMLIQGQHVTPQKALNSGYTFKYPTIYEAIQNLYSQQNAPA